MEYHPKLLEDLIFLLLQELNFQKIAQVLWLILIIEF